MKAFREAQRTPGELITLPGLVLEFALRGDCHYGVVTMLLLVSYWVSVLRPLRA